MNETPLTQAQRFFGDPAFRAAFDVIEWRLAQARAELESTSADKFLFVQGRVRALRDLAQDLSGRKH